MAHPSFGIIPPDEFAKAVSAPHGEAGKIIRQYDPLWGLGGNGKKYKVKCTQYHTVKTLQECTVEVEAADEQGARKLIHGMDDSEFKWRDRYDDEEDDDFEIESIEEIKGG